MVCVTSREYKIVLSVAPFVERDKAQKDLWLAVQGITNDLQIKVKGFMNEQIERKVRFFDTPNGDFNAQGYVLRVRDALLPNGQPSKTKAMLKFRCPDRVIAGGIDVSSPIKVSETKFEEDIIPPFRIQFSHSTSAEITDSDWKTIADVAKVFPGVKDLNLSPTTPVEIVNNFLAHEVVTRGGIIDFGKDEAPAAITLWYVPNDDGNETLAIAEFSFCYSNLNGEFSAKSAKLAKNLFDRLQQLQQWNDPNATTKTKFVYSYTR